MDSGALLQASNAACAKNLDERAQIDQRREGERIRRADPLWTEQPDEEALRSAEEDRAAKMTAPAMDSKPNALASFPNSISLATIRGLAKSALDPLS